MKPAIKSLIIFCCVALLYACNTFRQATTDTLNLINHTLASVDSVLHAADSIKKAAHDVINKVDSIKEHTDTTFHWLQIDSNVFILNENFSADTCTVGNLLMNCACKDTLKFYNNDTLVCSCKAVQ